MFKVKAKALCWLSVLLTTYGDSSPRAPTGVPALARKKHVQVGTRLLHTPSTQTFDSPDQRMVLPVLAWSHFAQCGTLEFVLYVSL